MHHTPSQK